MTKVLRDELSNDGLHPNEKGYAIMALWGDKAFVAALKKRRNSTNAYNSG